LFAFAESINAAAESWGAVCLRYEISKYEQYFLQS